MNPLLFFQDLRYAFDTVGNLRWRHDRSRSANLRERFDYDTLNRLTETWFSSDWDGDGASGSGSEVLAESVIYDNAGNIQQKGSQFYTYGYESPNGSCSTAGPHAVCSAGNVSYSYDATGNMTSDGNGRTINYSVFHKPLSITTSNGQTDYAYGAGRNRFLRQDSEGTTYFIGNVEIIVRPDGTQLSKRYLGNYAIQDVYLANGGETLNYTLRDHQGSVDKVTGASTAGQVPVTHSYSFSAWGERRDSDWQTAIVPVGFLRALTPHGYTGHEHIDHAGIIHMNGRIYDIKLGRFLQADPMVQAPENSQNLNRYSYVLNNPMSYTDPSGYFFKSIGNFFKKYGRQLAAIAITAIAPQIGLTSFWSIVGTGAVAGYVSSGSLKGALIGAFTAGAFYGIGDYFQGLAHQSGVGAATEAAKAGGGLGDIINAYAGSAVLTTSQQIGKTIAHGIAGGIMSELSGSKFGFGFASAGVTQAFSGTISDIGGGRRTFAATSGRVAAAATLGGVASELSGGKFINGAVTGAFSRAFNDEIAHRAHGEPEPLNKENRLERERALSIVARADPGVVNEISMGELDLIMRYDLGRMERLASAVGGYESLSSDDFAHQLLSHGDSLFYGRASYRFQVIGAPEGLGGVFLGGHINYYFQGFMRASAGNTLQTLHDSVINYNLFQGLTLQGLHNFGDIPASVRWATYGYDYYGGQ